MENVIVLIVFFCIVLLSNSRLKILSARPSILGAILFFSIFIQIIPGVLLVSFFDYPMSFGLDKVITSSVKVMTFRYTFASASMLLFFLYLFSFLVDFDIHNKNFTTSLFRVRILTFLSLSIILVKVLSVGNIPLIMAIRGDAMGASLAKADILRNNVGVGGFFFGYIFVYFPYVSMVYSFVHKKIIGGRWWFYINLSLIFAYSIYDMQKSKLVIVIFILSAVYIKLSRRINTVLLFLAPLISIVILMLFFILLHHIPINAVLDAIMARLFIGQTEGSYMIYQALTPDISRIAYGMPLSGFFGISSVDPAAEIIKIFFPTAGDAWVNSNSYFQAHAWSIFGNYSIVIGPFLVALNIVGLSVLRRAFSKVDVVYSNSLYAVCILTLPIVNDFSYFLFFKSCFCFIVLSIFYVISVRLMESWRNAWLINKKSR